MGFMTQGVCYPDLLTAQNIDLTEASYIVLGTTSPVPFYPYSISVHPSLVGRYLLNYKSGSGATTTASVIRQYPECDPALVNFQSTFNLSSIDPVQVVDAFGAGFVICAIPLAIVFGVSMILRSINTDRD